MWLGDRVPAEISLHMQTDLHQSTSLVSYAVLRRGQPAPFRRINYASALKSGAKPFQKGTQPMSLEAHPFVCAPKDPQNQPLPCP